MLPGAVGKMPDPMALTFGEQTIDRPFAKGSVVAIFCVTAFLGTAHAADDAGNFAIKGGGQQTCAALLKAYETKSPDLGLYAGWVDGYLTGINQFTPQTYDMAAWQTSDTLLAMTQAVCKQLPAEKRVIDAFVEVVRAIQPGRVVKMDALIALMHEGKGTAAYSSVIIQMKERLVGQGFDPGSTDDSFDALTAKALAEFQKAKGLAETGLPDQQTLYVLFRQS